MCADASAVLGASGASEAAGDGALQKTYGVRVRVRVGAGFAVKVGMAVSEAPAAAAAASQASRPWAAFDGALGYADGVLIYHVNVVREDYIKKSIVPVLEASQYKPVYTAQGDEARAARARSHSPAQPSGVPAQTCASQPNASYHPSLGESAHCADVVWA